MPRPSYYLMKSEPNAYSIDDLARDKTTYWDGVRNYQARNLMRDMKVGDGVLFYHSNAKPMAVVGTARVCREAYPDPTQFDEKSRYFDAKASKEKPRWFMVDIEFVARFEKPVTLESLKGRKDLEGMALLRKGQRLSVQPVTAKEWRVVCKLGGAEGS